MCDRAGVAFAALAAGRFAGTAFFTADFGATGFFGALAGAAFFPEDAWRTGFFGATFFAAAFRGAAFFATVFDATFFAATFFGTAFFGAAFFVAAFFGATFAAAALFGAALAGLVTDFFTTLAFFTALAAFDGRDAVAATRDFFALGSLPATVLPLVALACLVVRVDFAISSSRCGLAARCYSL